MSTISFLSAGSEPSVAEFMKSVVERFDFYSGRFLRAGLTDADGPRAMLDRLPSMREVDLPKLQSDAVDMLGGGHFLADRTTGTTGAPKLRISTARDDEAEAALARRFFESAGIAGAKRVVALDIDSADLYVFYGDLLLDLGVGEFTFLSVGADFHDIASDFYLLAPEVVIATPTLLARLVPSLLRATDLGKLGSLRAIVYLGESMPTDLRRFLEEGLQVEVFSFFGTTEIGSAGGECRAHTGIHLYTDSIVPTLIDPICAGATWQGEVAWTTAHFCDFPLVKYLSNDWVALSGAPCPCGASTPRIIDIRRTHDEVVLFGHKFSYDAFLHCVSSIIGCPTLLQMEVTQSHDRTVFSFVLPVGVSDFQEQVLESIRATDEIAYFEELGFIEVRVRFDDVPFANGRKTRRVIAPGGEKYGQVQQSLLFGGGGIG